MDEISRIKKVLERLLLIESEPQWSLSVWENVAKKVYRISKYQGSEVPELVWHYLSDADIRIKDVDYGKHQILAVKFFLA